MTGKAIVLAALAALCGCSTPRVEIRAENTILTEALLDEIRGTTVQTLEGAWKDEAFAAECVMRGDGDSLTIIFLSPQMRLATIGITRPNVIGWSHSQMIPNSLNPEYLIGDVAAVNLSTKRLREAIGQTVIETADGKRRTIVDDAHGRTLSVRQILPNGDIYFRNATYGYEFTVRKASHEN